ncbi:unnamed protein product [Rhizoctonia solani]|uniref:Uncharacterized protein n=1 Tax=Rhizoctonia solani TaxID=456999 RepID=A0A8H2WLX6_9AGAM|nr:unnamed protein product [Rhizoctonia solani]CAE6403006.1 unnamed protein product [Rhizoctonia solani]
MNFSFFFIVAFAIASGTMLVSIREYLKLKSFGGIKTHSGLKAESIAKPGIVSANITLIDDDEIQVLSPPTTGSPRRMSASLPLPPTESPVPPPQRKNPPRPPPPPEVIELDDDDDIIEIPPPTHRSPQKAKSERPIEPPSVSTQDEPMLDLNDLRLEERPPTPPPPEFPSFAKHTDVSERRFGPIEGTRRPGPSLSPALRASRRTALGQRMQDITTSDKLVQNLGLKGLKAVGWRTEKRERFVSVEPVVIPAWARLPNDKGKGRDPGERRPRPITELRLLPPRARATEIESGSESYPPRKPRKSSVAVHRDNTVKLEPIDLSFS